MITATALGAGIHFFPYSPRWLALVNRKDDCLSSLVKLRGLPSNDERVQAEFNGVMAEVNFQRLVQQERHPEANGIKLEILQWLDLFSRKTWRRTIVGVGIGFFQQFSGINAFIYYAPTLFTSVSYPSSTNVRARPLSYLLLISKYSLDDLQINHGSYLAYSTSYNWSLR
jgi:hypothetical protein